MRYEPVYMQSRALACLRAWPEILRGNADVYERLEQAQIITQAGGGALTQAGVCLRSYLDEHFGPKSTTNFFTLKVALCCWEPWVIMAERPDAAAFLALFGTDFSNPDVQHYVNAAQSGKLRPQYVPVEHGASLRYVIAEDVPERHLLALMAINETARAALTAILEERCSA